MSIIPYSRQSVSSEDIEAVQGVLTSDFLTQGPKIEEFEQGLVSFFEAKHAICCSSGTAALHLTYAALGANDSSIAIVPAITFAATANAFRYLGCKVIFCDVTPETGLICTIHLESILSNLPRLSVGQSGFIVPVSLAGSTAPLRRCLELANQYKFNLIEDASHAFGASKHETDGKMMFRSGDCNIVNAACLSFHPVKHLCCGEGGAVLTNSDNLARKIRQLRSHGMEKDEKKYPETPWFYEQMDLGWNYRMTDIQAALGISQLSRIRELLETRKRLAKRYLSLLSESNLVDKITLPDYNPGNAWHLFVIRFSSKAIRNKAYNYLRSKDILTQVHYIPVYKHPYYRKILGDIKLSGCESYFDTCLSIPLFPDLTNQQQDKVVREISSFFSLEK